MYENNERRIDWLGILKKLLMVVLALTVIFGIIALVTKCTKDEPKEENPIEEKEKSPSEKIKVDTITYIDNKEKSEIRINRPSIDNLSNNTFEQSCEKDMKFYF